MPADNDTAAEEDGLRSEQRVWADRQGSGAELFGGYSREWGGISACTHHDVHQG